MVLTPARRDALGRSPLLKPLVFAAALLPLAELLLRLGGLGLWGSLGANPVEAMVRFSGDWALRMLLVALAVTPLRLLTGLGWLARLRRMLGLFAFFYAALHLLLYAGLDQGFDLGRIWADVVKRTYITVGMAAFVVLAALAATSPKAMVRRLGGARWQALHRLVYPAAVLAVAHHALMVKADYAQPILHGVVLAALLAARPLLKGWRRRRVEGSPPGLNPKRQRLSHRS
ncbi:sulfite oxidase heme-binding subunit YedZ [Caenispirillum bisanense]|uniref:sulfite oxidase heme-binding subunit YedZ n=1 Tax=Caenispirillum bisanense TaxID=414052 RepID=UPI00337E90F3